MHQAFVGTAAAAVQTQMKMIEIVEMAENVVSMADLSVEYLVVEQAVRVVSMVAVEDWVAVSVVDIGAFAQIVEEEEEA